MYRITLVREFEKSIKKLSKNFPHILDDFKDLLKNLRQGNFQGDRLQGFPGVVYKARIPSSDQNKGKSGGFRTVYYVISEDKEIFLMEVYAKVNQENLSKIQCEKILKEIKNLKL